MKHVKINEAIVQAIKNLDIPVDKVDTEKLLSVFMDLLSLTEDETISDQDNDIEYSNREQIELAEQEDRLRGRREERLRTSFDKANTICKGLVEDRRVYIEQFLSDLYSLFIDNLRGIGSIYLLNAEDNVTCVCHRHYVIEQSEKGFINIESSGPDEDEINVVLIRYKNADVKVDLTTGIISFKFKLKRDHMPFNDTKEGIELFAINNRPFAHELANMVKLGL